jgi:Histidine kinase
LKANLYSQTMLRLFTFLMLFLFRINHANATLVLLVDGKKQNIEQKISLNAGYHEIVFLFPNDTTHQYQFYLEKLEDSWKKTAFPEVRYTNLRGGNYVFHGKVLKKNQVIYSCKVPIEIKENFWEKWWFWLFVAFFSILFLVLIIYFWFLYDFRQRMKTEQIRQRIAADLHDEIGANLSSITFLVGSLQKKIKGENADLSFLLEKITDNSTESATLINDTIWALNPSFDTFDKLLERIKSFASGLLSTNDIAFTIENNLTDKQLDLSIEQRRNLYLIIKEAINNVAKHASANKVILKINEDEKGIKINIEDNGKGFDTQKIYEGNGLENYKKRAVGSEFDVKIVSKVDFGTNVEIYLFTKNH